MTAEITVPALGESITEATVARWLKSVGDAVGGSEACVIRMRFIFARIPPQSGP